jgi:hypothetical protein
LDTTRDSSFNGSGAVGKIHIKHKIVVATRKAFSMIAKLFSCAREPEEWRRRQVLHTTRDDDVYDDHLLP